MVIRRAAIVAALFATLTLAACGGRSPFGDASRASDGKLPDPIANTNPPTAAVPATKKAASPTSIATSAPRSDTAGKPTQPPLPSTAGSAPAPAGTTEAVGSASGPIPKTLKGRIAADKTAMLNVRTMVSTVEGCHSGRPNYRDCNTHAELGSPSTIGVQIGDRLGQVRISASKNGFRMTAFSLSGAKFTVARGPNGDRFRCIPGPQVGGCPKDRTWSWLTLAAAFGLAARPRPR